MLYLIKNFMAPRGGPQTNRIFQDRYLLNDSCSISNDLHFTEHIYISAAAYLRICGIPIDICGSRCGYWHR